MKLAFILASIGFSVVASAFNPLTDKHCTSTEGKTDYTLIAKNAVIGDITGYQLIQYTNSQSVVLKDQTVSYKQVVNMRDGNVTTVYMGCDDGVVGECYKGGFGLMRSIIKTGSSTYKDMVNLNTTEENGNYDLEFICEKVESN